MDDFRCSVLSERDDEPIAGSAPTETEWLLVEDAGPWPAKATGHLSALVPAGGRAQLIRRHGRASGAGVRVFRATLGDATSVRTALVDDVGDLPHLTEADLAPHDRPLWLVCTNGRRDVCCAERGRPVAAALAARWPEETWETTHLGGHRFAATMLALLPGRPSPTLGRVDPGSAVAAATELLAGRLPLDVVRGRSGWPGTAQAADLHLREQHGWRGLDDVGLVGVVDDAVGLATPVGGREVRVRRIGTGPRPQSCADGPDGPGKPATRFAVEAVG